MARPADWWVLDLDGDPTPGDPVRVRQLASKFHDFADTAYKAKLAVESLQGDGALLTWVGVSGDAFREQFGEFPTQVNKLYRSHLMVGDALAAYAPVLENAQAQADRALADGRVAAEKVTSLQGALSIAQTDFTGASQQAQQAQAETQKPDPDQVKQAVRDADAAQQRLSGAQSQVDGAQHELDLAKQLAEQARQMRDGAAQACVREIEDASDAGIQPRSFWEKLGDALKELWNIICEVAKWVALVAGVIAMIIGGPLAWVALAAGAILLVKAVVDFAQGKGSVMDLVFGILGVIPGVKGLTTLSKLSALYKAGGVKEIANAALTGMKDMAKDMVGVVKAAGQGALTVVKKLGDSSGAVLGVVKSAAVDLSDAVRVGGAKIAKLFPDDSPKPLRDMPVGGSGDKTFGMPAAAPATSGGSAVKTFAQQFDDLKIAQTAKETGETGKIRADMLAKFDVEEKAFDQTFATDLKIKTGEIDQTYAKNLGDGTTKIEKTYTDGLKTQTDTITAKFDDAVAAKQTELTNAKFTDLKGQYQQAYDVKAGELQSAHDLKIGELDNKLGQMQDYVKGINDDIARVGREGGDAVAVKDANQANFDAVNKLFNDVTAEKAAVQDQLKVDLGDLNASNIKLAETDLAGYVQDLHNLKVDEMAGAVTQFRAAQVAEIAKADKALAAVRDQDIADLTSKLDAIRTKDISTETAALEKIKTDGIDATKARFEKDFQTDVQTKMGEIQIEYDKLGADLNGKLLDDVAMPMKLDNGTSVDMVFNKPGVDPAELKLLVDKNAPRLDEINPNKLANDVNCTICVQRVDEYLRTGNLNPAHKLQTTMPLHTIEVNYPGKAFTEFHSYEGIMKDMLARPDGTVGVVAFKKGGVTDGHVWNVWNKDGRIIFLDGQTGKLADLPYLNPGDALGLMPTT